MFSRSSFVRRFLIAVLLCFGFAAVAQAAPLPKRLVSDEIAKIKKSEPKGKTFRFVVMGDTRDGDAMFLYLMDLAATMQPAFIVDVGDLVRSGLEEQYRHYYDLIGHSKVPFISVVGNHENVVAGGKGRFLEMFGPTDYFFDYAGARFIMLDNSTEGYGVTDAQLTWLEGALKTDNVKMVFMHGNPRTRLWAATGMSEEKNNAAFMNLVEKNNVAKVYFGHVHAYDRLRRGNTEYVMTGCAGAEPDPISGFYDRIGGGYYHFLLVEVRDGKVMDVLVEPDTTDQANFPGVDGATLEFPWGGYRHFNTPVVESFEASPEADKDAPVTIRAFSSPDAIEVGLRSLSLSCLDSAGKRHDNIPIKEDTTDERLWTGALPSMPAGRAECYLNVKDGARSGFINVPSLEKITPDKPREALEKIPYTTVAEDTDDSPKQVGDALDILHTGMAYDKDYFYLTLTVQGGFEGGSKKPPRRLNIYGFALIDDRLKIDADVKKILGEIPVLVYAPYATAMGFPVCGVYNMREYEKGKIQNSSHGVKCKMAGKTLYMRADRSLFPADSAGVRVLAAAAQFIIEPKMDFYLGDASDIVHVRFGGYPVDVK